MSSLYVSSAKLGITNYILSCHRLIKITDVKFDVVFSITRKQKPREVGRSRWRTGSLCLVILRRLRETPLSFCLRVIFNEFHSNLEKTTSIVLSIILIILWLIDIRSKFLNNKSVSRWLRSPEVGIFVWIALSYNRLNFISQRKVLKWNEILSFVSFQLHTVGSDYINTIRLYQAVKQHGCT